MVQTLSGGEPGILMRESEVRSRAVRELDIETCGTDSEYQCYWWLKVYA